MVDAIGAAVNLSTREEPAEGIGFRSRLEGAYAGTLNGATDLSWGAGPLNGDLGIAALHTRGITSAASCSAPPRRMPASTISPPSWPYRSGLVAGRSSTCVAISWTPIPRSTDSFFGAPADSSDTSHFRHWIGYAGLNVNTGRRKPSLRDVARDRRDYRFMPGTPPGFGYRGTRWRADEGAPYLGSTARLVLGLSHDAPDYRFFGFDRTRRTAPTSTAPSAWRS